MIKQETLDQLVTLSRRLAEPQLDLVILGEGNTSARLDENDFYVKASGFTLNNIQESGFVRCRFQPILEAFDGDDFSDDAVRALLMECRADQSGSLLPSVETFLHAFLLTLPEIEFVGHTHAIAVNSILCSKNWKAMEQRIFPDQIVCCGPLPCFVEYTDPGIPLAKLLKARVEAFISEQGMLPRLILMQNHGLIAIGKTPKEIESITLMAVKTAKIMLGAASMGGINALDSKEVERIVNRPDEHYRRKLIEQFGSKIGV